LIAIVNKCTTNDKVILIKFSLFHLSAFRVHELLKLFTLRANKRTSYFTNNIYVRARVLAIETDLCRNAWSNERAFFHNYPNINLSKRARV